MPRRNRTRTVRCLVTLGAAVVGALALSTASSTGASARPPQPVIASGHDGLCLTAARVQVVRWETPGVRYVPAPDGTGVTTSRCPGWGPREGIRHDQHWTRGPGGTIRNVDGLCLDLDVSSPIIDGSRVQVWTCNGWANQRWQWDADTGAIVSGVSRGRWCLTEGDASTLRTPERVEVRACETPQSDLQWWYLGNG